MTIDLLVDHHQEEKTIITEAEDMRESEERGADQETEDLLKREDMKMREDLVHQDMVKKKEDILKDMMKGEPATPMKAEDHMDLVTEGLMMTQEEAHHMIGDLLKMEPDLHMREDQATEIPDHLNLIHPIMETGDHQPKTGMNQEIRDLLHLPQS